MASVRWEKRRKRFILDYHDGTKRRWKTMPKGAGRNWAKRELRKIENDIDAGRYRPQQEVLVFSEVAARWLLTKQSTVRHTTYASYLGHIRNHLNPHLGDLKIDKVSDEIIEGFKAASLLRGVSIPTTGKLLTTLGSILRYAVRVRLIRYNPASEVEKPKRNGSEGHKEIAPLTPTEVQRFLDVVENKKYKTLFTLAVLTGLRFGEIAGLKWSDIHWGDSQIQVNGTFNHGRFYKPKSKTSRRRVDLAPVLVQKLKEWKLACPKNDLDLVFPNNAGGPLSNTNVVRRHFHPALKRAGVRRVRFHDLRHGYASLMIEQGENIKYIQNQLGHATINIVLDVYGHLLNQTNQAAAERLSATVLGS